MVRFRTYDRVNVTDPTPRQPINAFEDIDSYRLVLGYEHLFNAKYLDGPMLQIGQTGLRAVFVKYTDNKYLAVFHKPGGGRG